MDEPRDDPKWRLVEYLGRVLPPGEQSEAQDLALRCFNERCRRCRTADETTPTNEER